MYTLNIKKLHQDILVKLFQVEKTQEYLAEKLGFGRSVFWRLSKQKPITFETFFKFVEWLDENPETYFEKQKIKTIFKEPTVKQRKKRTNLKPKITVSKVQIKDRTLDKRVKLSDENRIEIVRLYHRESISKNELARRFGVHKKTIGNVLDPEKYQKRLKLNKETKIHKKYYDSEKRKEYNRRHLEYKKELLNQKQISNDNPRNI
jgi:predicted DNA-binding protein (UPF0251 family)